MKIYKLLCLIIILTLFSCKKNNIFNITNENTTTQYASSGFKKSNHRDKKIKTKIVKKIRNNSVKKSKITNREINDCYDYYWVVYDVETGDIISYTFLFTRCDESNNNNDGTTTGTGGNINDEEVDCIQSISNNFNNFLEESNPNYVFLSAETGDIQNMNGVITKYKNISYRIFSGPFYELIAHSLGVVKLTSPNTRWRWVSLTHNGISQNGTTPPGVNISFTQGIGTPSFTPQMASSSYVYYAGMSVTFSVTFTSVFSCKIGENNIGLSPVVKTHTVSAGLWDANP